MKRRGIIFSRCNGRAESGKKGDGGKVEDVFSETTMGRDRNRCAESGRVGRGQRVAFCKILPDSPMIDLTLPMPGNIHKTEW